MKKSLLIALVGFMFVALTSFVKVAEPVVNTDNNTSINNPVGDSKEFLAAKALIQKYNNMFKNAKSCKEMEDIVELMEEEEIPYFEEKDMMTKDEESKIEQMTMELFMTVQNKVSELGCE